MAASHQYNLTGLLCAVLYTVEAGQTVDSSFDSQRKEEKVLLLSLSSLHSGEITARPGRMLRSVLKVSCTIQIGKLNSTVLCFLVGTNAPNSDCQRNDKRAFLVFCLVGMVKDLLLSSCHQILLLLLLLNFAITEAKIGFSSSLSSSPSSFFSYFFTAIELCLVLHSSPAPPTGQH